MKVYTYTTKFSAYGIPDIVGKVATFAVKHNLTIESMSVTNVGLGVDVSLEIYGELKDVNAFIAYTDNKCVEIEPKPVKKKFNLFKWWGV